MQRGEDRDAIYAGLRTGERPGERTVVILKLQIEVSSEARAVKNGPVHPHAGQEADKVADLHRASLHSSCRCDLTLRRKRLTSGPGFSARRIAALQLRPPLAV